MTTQQKVIKVIRDTVMVPAGLDLAATTRLKQDIGLDSNGVDLLASNIECLYMLTGYLYLSGMQHWETIEDIVNEIEKGAYR